MNLKQECEQSFYRELYHFDGRPHSLVMDETTDTIYLRKEADVFDLRVYQYLKENRNPHVAYVHAFWEENGKLVILEEYVEGETLAAYLAREKNARAAEADTDPQSIAQTRAAHLRIFREICQGVLFLHSATPPLIHRDLKASNVMITKDGVVKIIDYDAARLHDREEGQTRDTVLIGTAGVAAPEQYGFAPSDERTDIYALGVLMRSLFPDDEKMKPVIEKATRMDPDDRYESVEALWQAMQPKADDSHTFTRLWGLMGVAAAVLVIVAALFSGTTRRGTEQTTDGGAGTGVTSSAADTQEEDGWEAVRHPDAPGEFVTQGSYRMRVPEGWNREGKYYFIETGNRSAFLMTGSDDLDDSKSVDDIEKDIDLYKEVYFSGLTRGNDSVITSHHAERVTHAGIEMMRITYTRTEGGFDTAGEVDILIDPVYGGTVILTYAQSENVLHDHFDEFHAILDTLEMIEPAEGEWIQKRQKNLFPEINAMQVAVIEQNTITVLWYDESRDTAAVYWKGTFEAPPAGSKTFTFVSEEDPERPHYNLFAETADKKEFTIREGELVYTVSAAGTTQEIRLVPNTGTRIFGSVP